MSKNRSREQAKRRLSRIEAQRLCAELNKKARRRKPGSSKHPEECYTETFYVARDNSIHRTRVRSRSLDQIDETKISLAFWLMAQRMVKEEAEAKSKTR